MIQQQRNGGGLLSTGGRIVSEHGVMTLFRGLFTSCGREGLFTAGYLGAAPVIAGAGHACYIEQPATFDAILLAFIEGTLRSA